MASHNELGKRGEEAALDFLVKKGHQLLAQNYRFGRAEVDIITREGSIVVFTEVKTRSSDRFGFPEESVDKKKVRLVKAAAEEFMYQNKFESEVRFDIISITPTNQGKDLKIHHIKDAFFYEEDNSLYE